ncbi:hypothetical protein [Photobacterium leiognathi]|uniref:hypothetical protein n=1 Tax=Photobacterium leiognathi TaxID=553611 RepID=UPI002982327B|nr:hypothetical protein [Photobacterium leiognathi]
MQNTKKIESHFELALLWDMNISLELISSRAELSVRTVQTVLTKYLRERVNDGVRYSRQLHSYVCDGDFNPRHVSRSPFLYLNYLRTGNLNDVLLEPEQTLNLRVDDFVTYKFNKQQDDLLVAKIIKAIGTGNCINLYRNNNGVSKIISLVVHDIALTELGYVLRGYNFKRGKYDCVVLNDVIHVDSTVNFYPDDYAELDKDWNEIIVTGVPYPVRKPLVALLELEPKEL